MDVRYNAPEMREIIDSTPTSAYPVLNYLSGKLSSGIKIPRGNVETIGNHPIITKTIPIIMSTIEHKHLYWK